MKHGQNKTMNTKRIALVTILLVGVLALVGFLVSRSGSESAAPTSVPIVGSDGVQEVRMKVNGLDYEPGVLTVAKNQKVRWIIDATNAEGCARTMVSPAIGVKQPLKSGENIIEFTAPASGTIKFSCSMGMTSGQFEVV